MKEHANSTPERENVILPQSEQSPFAESQDILNEVVTGSIATPPQSTPNSQKAQDIEEGEIISSADSTSEKTGSKIAVGSAAISQQPTVDSRRPNDTEMEEGEIIEMDKEENSSPATSTLQQPNSDVAIGSVATHQQPVADQGNKNNEDIATADTADDWRALDINNITYKPVINAPPDLDHTQTTICISNISSDTKRETLMQLFGLNTTPYLRKSVRLKMFFNSSGKYKAYALVTTPKFVVDRILPLNGIIFNSRNLSMEINKSTTPYDHAAMQRGSSRQSHFPTSGNKNAKGEPRPVPNAASRQEESVSSINRIEDESGGTNPEGAGGRSDTTQNDKSMAQVLGEQQNRRLLEETDANCSLISGVTMRALPSQALAWCIRYSLSSWVFPKTPLMVSKQSAHQIQTTVGDGWYCLPPRT